MTMRSPADHRAHLEHLARQIHVNPYILRNPPAGAGTLQDLRMRVHELLNEHLPRLVRASRRAEHYDREMGAILGMLERLGQAEACPDCRRAPNRHAPHCQLEAIRVRITRLRSRLHPESGHDITEPTP